MLVIPSRGSDIHKTDNPKSKYLTLVFTVYVALLATAVSRHEPWMDEAQAWLLAKDLSVGELFVKYLRYEGSPGLWHLILMLPAKSGLPYSTINVLSAAISAAGVWLFLRYSPFPLVIKILFPFSYFAFFQYGVVARNYCLIPSLLFLLAMSYRTKLEHPYRYILLLCLLANVSAHTLLMSASFLFVHLLDVAGAWKRLNTQSRLHQVAAVLTFGLTAGLIYLTLLPPPDQLFARQVNWSLMNFIHVSKWMAAGALMLDESSDMPQLQFVMSLAVFGLTLFWLRQRKLTLLYSLPLLLILGLLAVKYRNLWHEGILFFLWLFALWISFDKCKEQESSRTARAVTIAVATVLAVQVFWCAYAVRYDFYHNYSGSYDAARYIKANKLEDAKIFVSGWKSIAILPYFEKNIFYNHNDGSELRFWFWSTRAMTRVGATPVVISSIERDRPDLVIFASDHIDPQFKIELEGYRLVGVFEGNLCWKTGLYEPDSYHVFRRSE